MKVLTWNINSINARMHVLEEVLKKHSPDVLMLQETKSQDVNFPILDLKSLGYEVAFKGQKSYNGIAVLTKVKPDNILLELPGIEDENARFCQIEMDGKVFICIYAPNGNPIGTEKFEYKLQWHEALNKHLKSLMAEGKEIVLGGDFNICPTRKDVYDFDRNKDNALCQPESIAHYNRLINMGFVDAYRAFHEEGEQYTFWGYRQAMFNYNKGWRIDFFLVTPDSFDEVKDCWIDKEFRSMEKPSDHTPLILEL